MPNDNPTQQEIQNAEGQQPSVDLGTTQEPSIIQPDPGVHLENIGGLLKPQSSVPTSIPKDFIDQIIPYQSGTNYRLYVYIKDAFKKIYDSAGGIITTFIPQFMMSVDATEPIASGVVSTNTKMLMGLFNLPADIIVNKLSIRAKTIGVEGVWDVTIYSEDGQTQEIAVNTGTVAVNANPQDITMAVSSVTLTRGNHWVAINSNGDGEGIFLFWKISQTATGEDWITTVTGEPEIEGYLTITAGTPPATFTPTDITGAVESTLQFRLDN